jgi:hypothetical protein
MSNFRLKRHPTTDSGPALPPLALTTVRILWP